MSGHHTGEGTCRKCSHDWAVPRTKLDKTLRDDQGFSYVPGLPRRCPECGSPAISYRYAPPAAEPVAEPDELDDPAPRPGEPDPHETAQWGQVDESGPVGD